MVIHSSRVGVAAATAALLTSLLSGYAYAAEPDPTLRGPVAEAPVSPAAPAPTRAAPGEAAPDGAAEPTAGPSTVPSPPAVELPAGTRRLAAVPDDPAWYAPADFTRSLIWSGLVALALASAGLALVSWRRRQW